MVTALCCALAYVVALGIGAFRLLTGSASLELTAQKEFTLLVEKAEAAGALGFMDQAFRDSIRQTMEQSHTLAAVLVGGPAGTEYAVQRNSGFLVSSVDGPRFVSRFDIAKKTLYAPLRLDGVRNATISVVRFRFQPETIYSSLRYALIITLIAIFVALLVLIFGSAKTKESVTETGFEDQKPKMSEVHDKIPQTSQENHSFTAVEIDYDIPEIADDVAENVVTQPDRVVASDMTMPDKHAKGNLDPDLPIGLYSPISGLGWNRYLREKLEAELRRSASFEQDLVLLLATMQYSEKPTDEEIRESADSVIAFFTFRDLAFDWNEYGFALILPNMDLDHGLRMSDEYAKKICSQSGAIGNEVKIRIGLSARAGRLVNAERLIMEAERALKRAEEDLKSPIVAFKPDPERYRNYISSNT